MASQSEDAIKEDCRGSFGSCLEIAGDESISAELFLWLKENYENLCLIQRWNQLNVTTELRWSLDDDAGYRSVYLEESLWGNRLMPASMLIDEADIAVDTTHLTTILQNPNCPLSIKEELSEIQYDDREWIEEVTEEDVEELRELANDLMSR